MNVESEADRYGKSPKGDVLKRIRNWEMQILKRTGSKEMQDLCEVWMGLPESDLKDAVYANILSGERSAAKIREILRDASRKKEQARTAEGAAPITTSPNADPEQPAPCSCTECNSRLFKDMVLQEIEKQATKKGVIRLKSKLKKDKYKNWEDAIAHLVTIVKEATAKAPRKPAAPASRKGVVCYSCSQKGHIARLCPKKTQEKKKDKKKDKTGASTAPSGTRVIFDATA